MISAQLAINATNTVSVVLGGLATGFTVTPAVAGFFQGNGAGLRAWGPAPHTLTLAAVDADGNTIIGNGAPVLTLASSSAAVQVAAVSPGVFSVQATTSGSPAVVTPGTVTLTATATPVNSPALPYAQTIALAVDHTGVFVSNGGNVLAFLDGNTTASLTLTNTNSPRGIAVDSHGTVYVGNHTSPGSVTECPETNTYAACTVPINGPNFVEGVAIDAAGNLWIADSGAGNVIEYLAGQSTPNFTLSTSLAALRGVSVDTNGNVWAADQASNAVYGYAPPLLPMSAPFATLTNGFAAPIQINNDGAGNLWIAGCGIGCGGASLSGAFAYSAPIASPNAPAISLGAANGLSKPEGVAVDVEAAIWIADNGNGQVVHCLPPAGQTPCTSFAAPGALWLAVYPSAVAP